MKYEGKEVAVALVLWVAAGVCEVSGGWMVWRWRREGGNWVMGLLGAAVVAAYALIATFQRQGFGRTYAAYAAFLIVLALLWAWALDASKPDLWDCIGAALAITGAALIMFTPRASS